MQDPFLSHYCYRRSVILISYRFIDNSFVVDAHNGYIPPC